MKINTLFPKLMVFFLLLAPQLLLAQVGINSTGAAPSADAMLDVKSSNKGVLIPRLSSSSLIPSPTLGLIFYNTTTNQFNYYNGTSWIAITNAANATGWSVNGNDIFNSNTGNVGIGTATPKAPFNVAAGKTVLWGADSSGAGSKFLWDPSKSAFRAGYAAGTEWDYANVGAYSTAMGYLTTANGYYSTAMGVGTIASGISSTAMGVFATANGYNSTALGTSNIASGIYSTALGKSTAASGAASTTMGSSTTASGDYSIAMGKNTTATGINSTTMGSSTTAMGVGSTAMGVGSNASGVNSTAMGNYTIASGGNSTTMGSLTTAMGAGSTAMGASSIASGNYSTAMGYYTIASGSNSTAMGAYNIDVPTALLMVGNGTYSVPSNAFTVLNDGKVGIGITTPIAPLHVAGSNTLSSGSSTAYWFSSVYNTGTTINSVTNGSWAVGLLVDYDIVGKRSIVSAQTVTTSDARIKNIIGLSNNQQDLDKVRQIQVTDYRYKDVHTWGNQSFKKVIAQQVEEVYPQAVRKMTSIIPDIYALADQVVFEAVSKHLTLTMSKNYEVKVGETIEFILEKEGKVQGVVASVSGNSFTVKDWRYPTDKIFVFGREVKDFRSVDYEAISMLGISAIQQLAKEHELLQKENELLLNEIKQLKNDGKEMNTRLSIIEGLLSNYAKGK